MSVNLHFLNHRKTDKSECDIYIETMKKLISKSGDSELIKFAFYSPSNTFKPSSCSEEFLKESKKNYSISIQIMRERFVPNTISFGLYNRFKSAFCNKRNQIYCCMLKEKSNNGSTVDYIEWN